jgi:protein phosphatase
MTLLEFAATAVQVTGPRDFQNDSFGYGPGYVVVADGVGSDVSARYAADLVTEYYAALATSVVNVDALLGAPARISGRLLDRPDTGNSTVVAALIDEIGRLWLTAIGDSRYVVVRAGKVLAHNEPHNRAAYARSLDPATPTTFAAESVLTRSLGGGRRDVPDVRAVAAAPGDVVVLMSDGVDAKLTLARILETVDEASTPSACCSALLAAASDSTLDDNATCLVAFVTERSAP